MEKPLPILPWRPSAWCKIWGELSWAATTFGKAPKEPNQSALKKFGLCLCCYQKQERVELCYFPDRTQRNGNCEEVVVEWVVFFRVLKGKFWSGNHDHCSSSLAQHSSSTMCCIPAFYSFALNEKCKEPDLPEHNISLLLHYETKNCRYHVFWFVVLKNSPFCSCHIKHLYRVHRGLTCWLHSHHFGSREAVKNSGSDKTLFHISMNYYKTSNDFATHHPENSW